jgi:hypothetical protein
MKRGNEARLGRYVCPPWQVKTPINRRHQTHLGWGLRSLTTYMRVAPWALRLGLAQPRWRLLRAHRHVVEDPLCRLLAKDQTTFADPGSRRLLY